MLKLTQSLILLSAFTAITFTGVVSAHSDSDADGKNRTSNRIIKKLDLSDDQAVQVTALFADRKNRSTTRQERAEQMRALIEAGNVDQAADMAANNAREKVLNRAVIQESLKAILTEEQLVELAESQNGRKGRGNRRSRGRSR